MCLCICVCVCRFMLRASISIYHTVSEGGKHEQTKVRGVNCEVKLRGWMCQVISVCDLECGFFEYF